MQLSDMDRATHMWCTPDPPSGTACSLQCARTSPSRSANVPAMWHPLLRIAFNLLMLHQFHVHIMHCCRTFCTTQKGMAMPYTLHSLNHSLPLLIKVAESSQPSAALCHIALRQTR